MKAVSYVNRCCHDVCVYVWLSLSDHDRAGVGEERIFALCVNGGSDQPKKKVGVKAQLSPSSSEYTVLCHRKKNRKRSQGRESDG